MPHVVGRKWKEAETAEDVAGAKIQPIVGSTAMLQQSNWSVPIESKLVVADCGGYYCNQHYAVRQRPLEEQMETQ